MNHRLVVRLGSALLVTLALIPALASAEVRAVRMTLANVAELRPGGPDAVGGIGDYFLGNGTLCAVVGAVDHETDLSTSGGTLVDLGFCDRPDDHYTSKQDLLDASRASPVNVHRVEVAEGPGAASILTIGGEGGLLVETRYTVRADAPTELAISRRVLRRHDDAPDPDLYAPVTFNYHSLLPFVFSSEDLARSSGFRHRLFHTEGVRAIPEAARAADTIVLVTPPRTEVPISYGWQLRAARRISGTETHELPRFALADTGALAFIVPVDTFYLGDGRTMGWMQLLQVPLLGLAPGDVLELDERILIGRDGTVAAITDQLLEDAPVLSGEIAGELGRTDAGIHVDLPDGTPVTATRPDAAGRFAVRVPTGDYRLRVLAPGGLKATRPVTVAAAGTDAGQITVDGAAIVKLPRGEALRLVFRGRDGTPDPDLQESLTGFEEIGGQGLDRVPAVFLAGIASDRDHVALPPGNYRVHATRGIEYDVTHTDLSIAAGDVVDLRLPLPTRAVDTPGVIAADLHVHASPSMDNAFPVTERVRTFVAEHAEVMVAAEHETVFDFAPVVAEMGVEDRLVVVTGTEMTSEVRSPRMPWTAGHANFFPLEYRPDAWRRGAPANENRRLREVLADVRRAHPGAVAQLNHARENDALWEAAPGDREALMSGGAYFEHLGVGEPFRPDRPLDEGANARLVERDPVTGVRDIDFDAMELVNGPHDWSPTRTNALRRDWFALLRQGVVLTGTANSDSHGKSQQVGLPRNMVQMPDDALAAFDLDAFTAALRAGRSYGTTGPLLDVRLEGAGLGELHGGTSGTLRGRVFSAPWIDVDRLVVQVDGHIVHEEGLAADGAFDVPLHFERDAFVTLEVFGEPGETYRAVLPGHRPYAFTNPVFVDADGDGRWTPPGFEAP